MARNTPTVDQDPFVKQMLVFAFRSCASTLHPKLKSTAPKPDAGRPQSFFECQRKAIRGSLDALKLLGDCYRDGIGTKTSPRDAVACYNQAASQGYAPALFELGRCYEEGVGVSQNLDVALQKYVILVKQCDEKAVRLYLDTFSHGIRKNTGDEDESVDDNDNDTLDDDDDDDRPSKCRYVGNCCYADSISSFVDTDKKKWLKAMSERHPSTSPYQLDEEQRRAWDNAYDVLREVFEDLCACDERYGDISIVFEYVMPIRNPEKASIDRTVGYRCDAVIVSSETVIAIEFKQWDAFPRGRRLERQADKYRKRLRRWHVASAGLTKKALFVPTKASGLDLKSGRVRVCSPDNLAQAIRDCFQSAPHRIPSLRSWLDSEWRDRGR